MQENINKIAVALGEIGKIIVNTDLSGDQVDKLLGEKNDILTALWKLQGDFNAYKKK